MSGVVLSKTYDTPPFCEREILRYAGAKTADDETLRLMRECISEAKNCLSYKVCYRCFPLKIKNNICDFENFSLVSSQLAKNLDGCERAAVFAATVGVGIDRLIAKYGRLSPVKALFFQAIGAERIETLCDTFCADLERELGVGTKPRFSAGYGDLPLESQRDIFSVLDCERKIGLTLNESMLMSPSKSVTAIVGIGGEKIITKNKCSRCNMKNCTFRSI